MISLKEYLLHSLNLIVYVFLIARIMSVNNLRNRLLNALYLLVGQVVIFQDKVFELEREAT